MTLLAAPIAEHGSNAGVPSATAYDNMTVGELQSELERLKDDYKDARLYRPGQCTLDFSLLKQLADDAQLVEDCIRRNKNGEQ